MARVAFNRTTAVVRMICKIGPWSSYPQMMIVNSRLALDGPSARVSAFAGRGLGEHPLASDSSISGPEFPGTVWAAVRQAAAGDDLAVEDLYHRYHRPLQTYLRYKFAVPDATAEELVHDFLTQKLAKCAAKADPQRGKFRNLLLTALVNHVRDWFKHSNATIRKPTGGFVSVDDPDVSEIPAPATEVECELEWTRIAIAEALRRVREFYQDKDKARFWQAFEGRIVRPLLEDAPPVSLGKLVEKCGFESPQAVSLAIVDAKRKFAKYLEEVIGKCATETADAPTEIRLLKGFLANAR